MTAQHTLGRACVLLAISALTVGSIAPTGANGAAAARVQVVGVADTAAVALVPASRLRLSHTPVFPMQTTPVCYILDNFGDPRAGGRTHEGSDMLATLGQEVYAVTNGTLTEQVSASATSVGASLSGNLWALTAGDGTGTYYVYAHLSAFAAGLVRGSVVHQGDLIGYVGDTGNAGPGNYHLHFEAHPNGGAAVNPLALLVIPRECSVH